jgi:hypothetical protein
MRWRLRRGRAGATRSGWWARCRCSGDPPTELVVVLGAEEGLDVRDCGIRKQFFDDRGQRRSVRGERAYDGVLDIAEGGLGFEGDRGVVDVPPVPPRRLVEIGGPAQQRNICQTGCARA